MTQLTNKTMQPSILGPQHEVPERPDKLLIDILSWPRSHQSPAETAFRVWLDGLLRSRGVSVTLLTAGVRYVEVGKSDTLFSCHIDTVDSATSCGNSVFRKSLAYDSNFGHILLEKDSAVDTCLGADDGVGVWLMLGMIEAKVPGGYIFHTGEECGGIGAKAVLQHHAAILAKYKKAVAFDRPGNDEIISHQRGRQCCASDAFCDALAKELNIHGFEFRTSKAGVYTDTYEYRKVIPECINVGVGYKAQHGRNETLDYTHAYALYRALPKIAWDKLPVARDHTAKDPDPTPRFGRGGYYGGGFTMDDGWDRPFAFETGKKIKKQKATVSPIGKPAKALPYEPFDSALDDVLLTSREDMTHTMGVDPDYVYDVLAKLAMEISALRGQNAAMRKMLNLGDM